MIKTIVKSIGIVLGLFLVFQLVPYGRDHVNPPVVKGPEWDSPRTRELFFRACKNCHSNETVWPWYSRTGEVKAWKGRGCVECNQKGHRGRVAIYEFFLLNEAIMDLIRPGLRTGELRDAARKLGWRSLREMAWSKVQRGLIPISEQERWTRIVDPAALLAKA